jgi:hypothetical protein
MRQLPHIKFLLRFYRFPYCEKSVNEIEVIECSLRRDHEDNHKIIGNLQVYSSLQLPLNQVMLCSTHTIEYSVPVTYLRSVTKHSHHLTCGKSEKHNFPRFELLRLKTSQKQIDPVPQTKTPGEVCTRCVSDLNLPWAEQICL